MNHDNLVRMFVFDETAKTGRVPTAEEVAGGLHLSIDDVQVSLQSARTEVFPGVGLLPSQKRLTLVPGRELRSSRRRRSVARC